jgi:polyhydroxybutyrate depolymerase
MAQRSQTSSRYHDPPSASVWGHALCMALVLGVILPGCAGAATSTGVDTTATPSPAAAPASAATPFPAADPRDRLVTTTGCAKPPAAPPGTTGARTIAADPQISNGATTRSYLVHVPASYRSDRPAPVILAFHGYGGTAAGMEHGSGLSVLAERYGFLAIYPQGLPFGDGGAPFWASAGPVDFGIDEIAFVTNLLNDLQMSFCVDAHRIYATGFSNGGGMTGYLACRLAGRIAAFAPASGNFYDIPGHCHPIRPAPILDFHGTADTVVPYDGISASQSPEWPLPSIPEWLAGWAARDGCIRGPIVSCRPKASPARDGHTAAGSRWSSIID